MNVEFWKPESIHGDEYFTRREDAEIIADHILKMPFFTVFLHLLLDKNWTKIFFTFIHYSKPFADV